jgi:hypothetical protein
MSETMTEGDYIINQLKNYNSNWKSTNNYTNTFFKESIDSSFRGLYIPTRNELLDTESLDSFLQNGGKTQKIIRGIRDDTNSDDEIENTDENEEMYGGNRNKPSPSDEYHQESINYLKDDLQLSPLEARAYKALAYRYIKENNQDSTALERAKLMLSLIKSENFLNEFKEKLDDTMKIIDAIDVKRSIDATDVKKSIDVTDVKRSENVTEVIKSEDAKKKKKEKK